jgi:uncharacterized protein YuzE
MEKKLGKLLIDYDEASDVLYLSLGEPRQALTYEGAEGLLLRKDPQTGELVGVTVLSYDRHFRHLPNVSWLENMGLPPVLLDYLEERPEF